MKPSIVLEPAEWQAILENLQRGVFDFEAATATKADGLRELIHKIQEQMVEPKEMRAGSPKYQSDVDIINSIIYEIRNSGNKKPGANLYLGYKQIRALSTIEKDCPQEFKNNRFCGFTIVVVEKEYWCKLA